MTPPLVVPPHADFTLARTRPGAETIDLAQAFAARLLDPATVRAEADRRLQTGGAGAKGAITLLASADLLAARDASDADARTHAYLRAAAAVFTGLSEDAPHVRLRLDDLELVGGSTERSVDVERIRAEPSLPWRPELDSFLARTADEPELWLWLQRDQQLPAAFELCARAPAHQTWVVSGPFGWRHRAALAEQPALHRVRFAPPDARARVVGSPGLPLSGAPLPWYPDGQGPSMPEKEPWGGPLSLGVLDAPDVLAARGCRVMVLSFCAASRDVIGHDGVVRPLAEVRAAAKRLREQGVHVVAEWWIGAPGVDEAELDRTLEALEAEPFFDVFAGLRPFHWPLSGGGSAFAGRPVQVGTPPTDLDLARSRPFVAAGTPSPEAVRSWMESRASRLRARWPQGPGRNAQLYVTPPAVAPSRGERLRLDPDCAIVSSPAGGAVAWHAVQLRTGLTLAVDGRVAPLLAPLRMPASPGEALARLPAAAREKLVRALVEKAVLQEVA